MIATILKKGYFPKELPSPLSSGHFASIIQKNIRLLPEVYGWKEGKTPECTTRPTIFNLAGNGELRRKLSIPNPINLFEQAKIVSDNCGDLETHYSSSNKSLSQPEFSRKQSRAINWENGFDALSLERLRIRASERYISKTDTSKFFLLYMHNTSDSFKRRNRQEPRTDDENIWF